MGDWIQASNQGVEVRIDFNNLNGMVEYRFLGELKWKASPFKSENFRKVCGEKDALKAISKWADLGM